MAQTVKITRVVFRGYVHIKWQELDDLYQEEEGLQPLTHDDFIEFIKKLGFNPEKHELHEWVNNEFIGKHYEID